MTTKPKIGSIRTIGKFAWLPKKMWDTGDILWLEKYCEVQEWQKDAGSLRMRGTFKNYYYNGWFTIKITKHATI
jgi:hypothetical protein